MKKWISKVFIDTCVGYTIFSLIGGLLNLSKDSVEEFYINLVMMFVWTGLAIAVLNCYTFIERWPPILTIAVQYIIAMALVFLTLIIARPFWGLHPNWLRDAFRSFTVPYVIFAAVFYIETFNRAKKADDLLRKLRDRGSKNNF